MNELGETIAICIAVVLIVLGIGFFLWEGSKDKTLEEKLYDKCFHSCDEFVDVLDETSCERECLEIFGEKMLGKDFCFSEKHEEVGK